MLPVPVPRSKKGWTAYHNEEPRSYLRTSATCSTRHQLLVIDSTRRQLQGPVVAPDGSVTPLPADGIRVLHRASERQYPQRFLALFFMAPELSPHPLAEVLPCTCQFQRPAIVLPRVERQVFGTNDA